MTLSSLHLESYVYFRDLREGVIHVKTLVDSKNQGYCTRTRKFTINSIRQSEDWQTIKETPDFETALKMHYDVIDEIHKEYDRIVLGKHPDSDTSAQTELSNHTNGGTNEHTQNRKS